MALLKIRNAADTGWVTLGGASFDDVPATYKHNLKIVPGTTTTSEITVTADQLAVANTDGDVVLLDDVSEADIDITASGAQGLDTGSEASSTMYYIWIIYNGTTVAGLLSTSETSPTMPSGYTYKRCVGEVYNNSSSNFVEFQRLDDLVVYDTYQTIHLNATAPASYTSKALPASIPTGCQEWLLEGASISTTYITGQNWSPYSDGSYNVPLIAYGNAAASYWIDYGAGAGVGIESPMIGWLINAAGSNTVYWRHSINTGGTYAYQTTYVKAYRLKR